MNIRKIYNLEDIEDENYKIPKWCDHDAFFSLSNYEIDEENFNYEDARLDERVKIHLKATADVTAQYVHKDLRYWAVSFDSSHVGLVIGLDTSFGWDSLKNYITNYPKYQAMVAYVKLMYQNPPEYLIGETVKIEDLDGRYGFVIDKRYKNNMRKEEK